MSRFNVLFILASFLFLGCSTEKTELRTIVAVDEVTVNTDFSLTDTNKLLADVATYFHLKLDCPDDDMGATSLRLHSVGWRQIFWAALAGSGYGYYEEDGVVIVRSDKEISALPLRAERIVLRYQKSNALADYLNRVFAGVTVITPTENGLAFEIRPERRQSVIDAIARIDAPEVKMRRFEQTPHFPPEQPPIKPVPSSEYRLGEAPLSDNECTDVFTLEHVDALLVMPYIEAELELQRRVRIDFPHNALIVTAKESLMPRLMAIVRYLDDKRWYQPEETAH